MRNPPENAANGQDYSLTPLMILHFLVGVHMQLTAA
jgi:hypothetical protein